jgi:hypothetical protein
MLVQFWSFCPSQIHLLPLHYAFLAILHRYVHKGWSFSSLSRKMWSSQVKLSWSWRGHKRKRYRLNLVYYCELVQSQTTSGFSLSKSAPWGSLFNPYAFGRLEASQFYRTCDLMDLYLIWSARTLENCEKELHRHYLLQCI